MSRILALDIGAKRTGIAVTDQLQIIATALEVIPTKDLLDFLKNYLGNEPVEQIVLGYPLHKDNNPTDATPLVEKWMKTLKKNFPGIEIYTEDESFTSKKAVETMVNAGFKKKDRRKKGNIDKISAVLILQTFLENKT